MLGEGFPWRKFNYIVMSLAGGRKTNSVAVSAESFGLLQRSDILRMSNIKQFFCALAFLSLC